MDNSRAMVMGSIPIASLVAYSLVGRAGVTIGQMNAGSNPASVIAGDLYKYML